MIGLLENTDLNTENLMIFIYGLINDSFENLTELKKRFFLNLKLKKNILNRVSNSMQTSE